MILPPRKKMWASRNRRPINRELRKVSLTWFGCAEVAREQGNAVPTTWQFDKLTESYIHPATHAMVKMTDLRAWEKMQKTPDGKDALRGVKLAARLEQYVLAQQTAGAVSDATGTP